MKKSNQTTVTYFIFKGITEDPTLHMPIFLLVLLMYLLTLCGNMTILHLVCLDTKLHTPMYFFLGNLSLLDICCTTVVMHEVLFSFISGDNTVSFCMCLSQVYLFSSFTSDQLSILTAMSYDRYVAICNPLHYNTTMSGRACGLLATVCWMLGLIAHSPHVAILSRFSCYKSNIINHFFCDLVPLINLSCNDTSLLEQLMIIEGLSILTLPHFFLTLFSYIFIIITILKIRSNIGRRKAFYTCSSHLTVVILLYLTLFFQYLRPSSTEALDSNKLFSLCNTSVVPLLNPIIYCLKNDHIKMAMKRRLRCTHFTVWSSG